MRLGKFGNSNPYHIKDWIEIKDNSNIKENTRT